MLYFRGELRNKIFAHFQGTFTLQWPPLTSWSSCSAYWGLYQLFSVRGSLIFIFLFFGIGYLLHKISPPMIQFFLVVQGKMLVDMTWILMGILAYRVVPDKDNPLLVSTRCAFDISMSVVFCYGKYWLEAAGISIFVFSGLSEIGVVAAIFAIKEIR